MPVSLIAGLGNSGTQYQNTRHNLGFCILDNLANEFDLKWQAHSKFPAELSQLKINTLPTIMLVKTLDYMNNSGKTLAKICRYYQLVADNMIVIYDDLTLALGRLKISLSSGAGGHNGVKDILLHCSRDFVRFRVGIGPKPFPEMTLTDFVLGKFSDSEKSALTYSMPHYIKTLKLLIKYHPLKVMNLIHEKK